MAAFADCIEKCCIIFFSYIFHTFLSKCFSAPVVENKNNSTCFFFTISFFLQPELCYFFLEAKQKLKKSFCKKNQYNLVQTILFVLPILYQYPFCKKKTKGLG